MTAWWPAVDGKNTTKQPLAAVIINSGTGAAVPRSAEVRSGGGGTLQVSSGIWRGDQGTQGQPVGVAGSPQAAGALIYPGRSTRDLSQMGPWRASRGQPERRPWGKWDEKRTKRGRDRSRVDRIGQNWLDEARQNAPAQRPAVPSVSSNPFGLGSRNGEGSLRWEWRPPGRSMQGRGKPSAWRRRGSLWNCFPGGL